jgi:hypothetical protein
MKILKKGTILYRGSHSESISAVSYIKRAPNYLRTNRPAYFSNTENSVHEYGTAVKYETTCDLNLINMGNVNEVARLITLANSPDIIQSIKKSFRISNGIIRRSSKIKYDIPVAVFICKQGYDGYYAPRLPTKYAEGSFHPEVVLCNPSKVLKVVSVSINAFPPRLERKK